MSPGEARAGEKLDSEERRKRKAKEVQEFDGFDVDGRVATLYFTARQSSLQHVHLANANFADLKARRNSDKISFYVVPPQGPPQEAKDWSLLKNFCGIRDTSQVFATCVEEGLNKHGLQKDAAVLWRDGFTLAISGVRANDHEQLTHETFRVRACDRVDPGFLTTVEILRRKSGVER